MAGTNIVHLTKTCPICDNEFAVPHWRKEATFCSHKCKGVAFRGKRKNRKPIMDRFWDRVDKTPGHGPRGDCWLWIGHIEHDGYGVFKNDEGHPVRAHKFSYVHHKGPVHAGLNVCHDCDVRNCINPDHLWLGTTNDNTQDMYRKGRGKNLRGNELPQSKLTSHDVIAIRESCETGKALAERYGVSRATISLVINRKAWAHV